MEFTVEQDSFSGPLGLLLDLLDKKELEIADVALAKISDNYLLYLEEDKVPSEELADFLTVASRLIYLKSRELMKYLRIEEEEIEVASLEDQLRLYKIFSETAEKIAKRVREEHTLLQRPFKKIEIKERKAKFVSPKNVDRDSLLNAFMVILKKLEPFFALQEASIERVKSVEERIDELKNAIVSRAKMSFKEVVAGARSRPDVVVSFLALLELIRRQVVKASQSQDDDIIIERL